MSDLFSIAGKTALITGGTAGIGQAVAAHFVKQGAKVVISGRRKNGAEIAADMGAKFVQADMANLDATKRMIEAAHELLGKLDVLVLNAGVGPLPKTIEGLSPQEMRELFSVNFDAVYAGVHHSIPYLNEGASIIITSSAAGITTAPTYGAYSPAKAACVMLARSAATELGGRFRVNCILPGPFATEMMTPDDHEYLLAKTLSPIGRLRTPQEIVGAYQFLASQASACTTGTYIACDDGLSSGTSMNVMQVIMKAAAQ
ncbi:SDR family NAD(P)-dependent oxidoreductase [Ottowia sp.]|uniref:SDR family NAD(P)-dependent oxidoreductase n=1 Tax=Ottowia sp. TaxID=1898956 RepID=UPI003A84D309